MSDFCAAAQWAGNFYQVRFGLVKLLELKDPEADLFIEAADDVVASVQGGLEHFQTKLHQDKGAGSLTDKSVDLWKTLRVWSGLVTKLQNSKATFHLVTTAKAPSGSAAYYLGEKDRNESEALKLLEFAATASKNEETAEARLAFRNLKPDEKTQLLKSTFILPEAGNLSDLDNRIEKALYFAIPQKLVGAAVKRLKQWWLERVEDAVLQMVGTGTPTPISGADLHEQVMMLKDKLNNENLPADFLEKAPDSTNECFDIEKMFVKQLNLCGDNPFVVEGAAYEYWRATEQRGAWAVDGLLNPGELTVYDTRLKNTWHSKRGYAWKNSGAADDEQKRAMGLTLLENLQDCHIPIRNRFSHEYVMRGTYHILADQLEVGWHPDWEKLKPRDDKP